MGSRSSIYAAGLGLIPTAMRYGWAKGAIAGHDSIAIDATKFPQLS